MDKPAPQAQGREVADYFDLSDKGGPMKKRALSIFTRWSLLVTLVGLLSAPSATAQGFDNRPLRFTVTDLGTLGGMNSQATAINNRGQVVGYSTLAGEAITRAFLWEDGVMTDLGSLGGTFSRANAINNRGQAVGASEITDNAARHAALFDRHGITDLGALPASLVGAAFGINNRDDIFGGSTEGLTRTDPFHATRFKDGGVIDLGTLGGLSSFAAGVNNGGQAVGRADLPGGFSRAVIFSDGVITDLGTLPGGTASFGRAINNRGEVACLSNTAAGAFHACLWRHGVMTDLGTLGGTFSDSAGIDNRHRIVGASTVASGQQHAYIFSKAKMTDLNELIPADSGWTLVAATGINDVGEIVGNGRINGQTHAFLLTPDDDDED
jgi:probable HAF family extracellular repeat protein